MDSSVVSGVEAPRDRLKAQLLGTLTPRFAFEGAQRLGVGKARFVFEDVRVRPKVGVPLVNPRDLRAFDAAFTRVELSIQL